jgi:drug/metabolite transporter (DMT)-like permease
MARLLTILFFALIFEAIGVVFLSRGLKQIGELQEVSVAGVARLVAAGVTNRHIVLGVFFEALFFVGLLMLMSKADVSFVWPLTSLSFVVTTIAAKIYLHEQVSPLRWSGVCLIMMGAALISWTERNNPAVRVNTQTVQSPANTGMPPQ